MTENEETEAEVEYKYVIGQDPGGTTGVAALRYTDTTQPELIYLHQIADGKEGYYEFFGGSVSDENVVIVSEKWVEREGIHGADHEPLIIEGVQYTIWFEDIVYQEPSQKSLISDDWLKEQNLWTPGKRHQMDALIHAFVYLRNSGHKPTLESLTGRSEQTIAQEGEAESKQLSEQESDEGQPDPDSDALAQAIQQMREAMEQFGQDAQTLSEAMEDSEGSEGEAGASTATQSEVVPTGQSGDQNGSWDGKEVEVKGTRKRRERNGVFAGFDPGEGDNEVELYSD